MVLTVRVALTALAPVIAGGAETEHVGASTPPAGVLVTAQLKATLPVKPPLGVIVTVDVGLGPGDAIVIAVPLSANPGGAGTVTAEDVETGSTMPAASAAVIVMEY